MSLATCLLVASTVVVATPLAGQRTSGELFHGPSTGLFTNGSLVSDYLFRGETLSGGQPAIQGGADFEIQRGGFLGVWGSSGSTEVPLELDFYGGWTITPAQFVEVEARLTGFVYPHKTDGNSLEASLLLEFANPHVGYHYDFVLEQHYVEVGALYSPVGDFYVDARGGLLGKDRAEEGGRPGGMPNPVGDNLIWDFELGAGYDITGDLRVGATFVNHEHRNTQWAIGATAQTCLMGC